MEQKPVQSMHIEQTAPAQSPQPACAAQPVHKTTIGGQAVIEGVMMRGPEKTCVAVRKPDGEIELRVQGAQFERRGLHDRRGLRTHEVRQVSR